MRKKYIVLVLVSLLLVHLCGCYSMREISKDEIAELKEGGDLVIYTKDSTIYSFQESEYQVSNDSLYGRGYVKFTKNSAFKVPIEHSMALKNIIAIERDELNPVTTTLLIMGSMLLAVGGGFLIALAMGMSGR